MSKVVSHSLSLLSISVVSSQENMLRLEETMNLFIEKLEQERERSEVCHHVLVESSSVTI